jgi:hypothetical protein
MALQACGFHRSRSCRRTYEYEVDRRIARIGHRHGMAGSG